MADPLVGQSIGPFSILGRLGAGAMGVVYKARYTNGALVALKLMSGNVALVEPDAVARFEREAQILQQLKHERIVRLYGTGRHHGSPYYAMEFVHGENLAEMLHRKGKLAWQEVADLCRQLCEALQHAHDHGVVHRDLKPSNLMIAKDGSLKLADFGIAKDLDQTQLTSANCAVGTAAYMAPEQCRAQNITPRTDLYSLGVVMFELLTGTRPFSGESSVEIFQKHLQEKPQKPSRLVYDIPAGFDTLVLHLMEKSPDRRPPDARTVAESLTRLEERQEGLQQAGTTRTRRKGKRPGRSPQREPFYRSIWVVGPSALAFMTCMGFFGWWVFFCPPSPTYLAAEIERLDRDGSDDAWRTLAEANGPAAQYMALYGSDATAAPRIKAILDRAQAREGERLLRRHMGQKGQRFRVEPPDATGARAFAAVDLEEAGSLDDARLAWEGLLGEGLPWSAVARRHLWDLAGVAGFGQRLDSAWGMALEEGTVRPATTDASPLARAGFMVWRGYLADQLGDSFLGYSLASDAASLIREDLDTLMLSPPADMRTLYLYSRRRVRGTAPANVVESRKETIGNRLARATTDPSPAASAILSAIVQVYEPTIDLAALGREAANQWNKRAVAPGRSP